MSWRWLAFLFVGAVAFVAYDRFHHSKRQQSPSQDGPAVVSTKVQAAVRAPASAEVPRAAPRPDWSTREHKDGMTDEVSSVAYRELSSEGGYRIRLEASCIPALNKISTHNRPGVWSVFAATIAGLSGRHMAISIEVLRNDKPSPLHYKVERDKKTEEVTKRLAVRYRVDERKPRLVSAMAISDNNTFIAFGRSVLLGETFGGLGIFGALFSDQSPDTALSLPISLLSLADQLRIEIPLEDGTALTFNLLPRDSGLKLIAQNCGFQMCRIAKDRGNTRDLPFIYKDNVESGSGWYLQNDALVTTGALSRDTRGNPTVRVRVADLFMAASANAQPDDVKKYLAHVGTQGWMYLEHLTEEQVLCDGE